MVPPPRSPKPPEPRRRSLDADHRVARPVVRQLQERDDLAGPPDDLDIENHAAEIAELIPGLRQAAAALLVDRQKTFVAGRLFQTDPDLALETGDLPAGVYWLFFEDSDGQRSGARFVKQ